MSNILTNEQKESLLRRIGVVYKNFKAINRGNWTHESAYKMGIIDFCDSIIFVSSQHTCEVASLRAEVEFLFDEIDNEEQK